MAALAAIGACCALGMLARGFQKRARVMLLALRLLLAASMCTTQGILLAQGRWREALPLHLCSLAALCAVLQSLRGRQGLLDFLVYPGMPGALLALIFPAPAVSRWQTLLDTSYYLTHALILVIPVVCLCAGRHVRRGRALRHFAMMQGLAAAAYAVNRALGTDYLFLMAPPAATPLETVFSWGYPAYLLALEGILCALLAFGAVVLPAALPGRTR